MLRSTQLEPLYVKRVGLALRTQFVRFLQHDLKYMHPDENGIKVIQMATAQLSYVAVKLATSVTKQQKNKLKTKQTNKTQETKETKETKESITKESNTEENKIENVQDAGTGGWLETVRVLVNEVNEQIQHSIDHSDNAPFLLNLEGITETADSNTLLNKNNASNTKQQKKSLKPNSDDYVPHIKGNNGNNYILNRRTPMEKAKDLEMEEMRSQYIDEDEEEEEEEEEEETKKTKGETKAGNNFNALNPNANEKDKQLMQWCESLAWEVEQVTPDPGQAEPQPKYIPVDPTILPSRCSTRVEAIDALRLTDRLCTLISNQHYCIKNSKHVIASLIQHVVTTVIPIPKPRGLPKSTSYRKRIEKSAQARLSKCRVIFVLKPSMNDQGGINNSLTTISEDIKMFKETCTTFLWEQSKQRSDKMSRDQGDELYHMQKDIEKKRKENELHQLEQNISQNKIFNNIQKSEGKKSSDEKGSLLFSLVTCSTPKEAKEYVKAYTSNNPANKTQLKATLWNDAPKEITALYDNAVAANDNNTTEMETKETKENKSNDSKKNIFNIDVEKHPIRTSTTNNNTSSSSTKENQPAFQEGVASSESFLNYDLEHNGPSSNLDVGSGTSGIRCLWDVPIDYATQVELQFTLLRLMEHFSASALSMPQSRSFDAVCCIVPACLAAYSDVIMRLTAVDHPSPVCTHLMGKTTSGKQLGHSGYGLSVGSFATQTDTMLIHVPELVVARTAVLD